ncbi:MAG TPA: hypothetical protein VD866_32320, partial [Urbifossiella sp.]|nr:hypothetical protein [Urbifossiella sp.]
SPPWTAFASLLCVLLSLFAVPVALEPYRYPGMSRLLVVCRLAQALFFLFLYSPGSMLRGLIHLALFAVQLPLAYVTRRGAPRPEQPDPPAPEAVKPTDLFEYAGSTFDEVKAVAMGNPYVVYPTYRTLGPSNLLQLLNAAARNLHDRRDIRPYFDKLIHAHGICFTGLWEIDADSPFTGYFARGSRGLLVVRASVAGPNIRRGQRRSLGIAGKVFPTLDPTVRVKPGNFVTVAGLTGTLAKHVTDFPMTNAPKVGLGPAANVINRLIFRIMDTRPGIRLLHPISTLGLAPGDPVRTPDLLLLTVAEGTLKVDADDFRDELRLKNYPGGKLVYTISVKNFADPDWSRIGTITLTEDAVTEGGDKRIHFWIPADVPSHN